MGEDGKNISDDMSSLLHAAEEWANERLFGINSSNDLDDSISYVVFWIILNLIFSKKKINVCRIKLKK